MPPTPTTTVTGIGLNTITTTWTISDYDQDVCGLLEYNVTISDPLIISSTSTGDSLITYTGLSPNTSYTITVTPNNSAGHGQSASIVVKTLSGELGVVMNVS